MLRIVHTGCGAIEGIAAPEPEITVSRYPVRRAAGRRPALARTPAGGSLGGHAGGARLRPRLSAPTPGDSNEFYDREWGTDPAIALDEDCLYLNVWTPRCAAATRTHG